MKKIKNIIIILVVLLTLTSVILINVIKMINKVYNENYYDDTIPQDTRVELKANIHKETNEYKFFGVNDFINQFLKYINIGNKEAIYGLLDSDYKNKHNTEDIIKYTNQKGNISDFYVKELYKRESANNFVYYTTGIAEVTGIQSNTILTNMCFQLYIDNKNNAASIKMLTMEEYQKEINDLSEVLNEKRITQNEYNIYKEPILSNWELAQRYLSDYKFKLKNDIEEAFNLLDTDYRNTKFNNQIEKFKQYILENKETLYNIEIHDCESKINQEYIEYIIKDVSGNVYIIRRTNAMEYTVLLDTDTI